MNSGASSNRCLWPAILLAAICLTLLPLLGPARAGEPTVRIADGRGDWGLPNPFHHYPRGPGYIHMSWVFDTLVWKDHRGELVPALANSWAYEPQRQAFTFQMNPQAQWHDGTPVTAADVAFTIDLFQRHPTPWVNLKEISHAEVTGSRQVTIFLRHPYAPFLADIGGTMPIMPAHIWREVEEPTSFTEPGAFIGSGPFRFIDFNKVQGTYLYEAFADYYQGRPKAARLIYLRSSQPLVALSRGEVDLAAIQPEMADALKKQNFTVLCDERGWNRKLMINHRRPPFSDRRFRQALAHAIDREALIAQAQRGHARPASYGLLSKDHSLYNPDLPDYAPDPAKARALLEEMGYTADAEGFYQLEGRPLIVELLVSNITAGGQSVPNRDGEKIRRQLARAGIRVELVNMEQAVTDQRIRDWQFDLALSGHGGVAGDARILNEMISPNYSGGSVNSARFDANPELEELLATQLRAMEPDERRRLVHRIQELHALELPAMPLYYPDACVAYNPRLGIDWFYTPGGVGKGIPIPQNKLSVIGE